MKTKRISLQNINHYSQQLFLFIIVALLCGCSEDITNKNNGNSTDIYLQFSVITTDATPPKNILKSGQTDSESTINQVQILVFENDLYQYRVTGTGIANSGTYSATFKARLLSSDQPTTIYIIANSDTELNANEPQVGDNISTVKNRLIKSISTNPISGNLSMWGSYSFPSGLSAIDDNTITNVRMLRAVARVDVIANAVSSNFQLVSIQAFRVANNMQIIPDNPTTTPSVTEPSVPVGTSYNINTSAIATLPASSVAQLYLPESPPPTSGDPVNDATCIIVGGYYSGSSTITYYRLDLNPGTSGHPLGQILRNHRYEFNITSVLSEGYSTPQDAANNISSSMEARIVLWSDYVKHMVFDLYNYLGVSESYITLAGEANSSYNILVQSNLPNYSMTWADRTGLPEGSPSSSLSDDYFLVDKASDGSSILVTATQINLADSTDRVRYILLQEGA